MKKTVIALTCLLASLLAVSSVSAAVDKETGDRIVAALTSLLPGVLPDEINETPVAGIYEVALGPRIIYISADGKYLMQGEIIDLKTRENITEPRQNAAKIRAINAVGSDNMLVFSPPEGTPVKHQVNVFTDIDCGYCRKLHSEMEAYNKAGIEIRYLFYPRAGKNSESYTKAVKVWCAKDRHEAMNLAKAGKEVDAPDTCKNPVEEHMMLGSLVGVSGTPALLLEDGQLVPGYVPASRLSAVLDQRTAEAKK
jgi:thiol:disulfide interchange protein DsbC